MPKVASINFNTSIFSKNFIAWSAAKLQAAKEGVGEACEMLLNDTVVELPTAPVRMTYLRGSASVFVNGRFRRQSSHGIARYLTRTSSTKAQHNQIIGETVFNAPYSARWHENWPPSGRFRDPSAGIKYMERKLYGNAHKYFAHIAYKVKTRGKP